MSECMLSNVTRKQILVGIENRRCCPNSLRVGGESCHSFSFEQSEGWFFVFSMCVQQCACDSQEYTSIQ